MSEENYIQPENVTKRVRFYDGQFLQAQDFVDEQAYHVDRQRLHNRGLHLSGVVSGLDVELRKNGELWVQPGAAVDADGRQIVLTDSFQLREIREGYLHIAYRQAAADEQQAEKGIKSQTRWEEIPYLFIDDKNLQPGEKYTPPGDTSTSENSFQYRQPPPVLLAHLTKDGDNWKIDLSERHYSGLRLPGPGSSAQNAFWRADSQGKAGLWLTRTGADAPRQQLSVAPAGEVEVNGDLKVDGELAVEGQIRDQFGLVMPVGVILPYAGSAAPDGWMLCDGKQVDKSKYPALYKVIGYTYGGSNDSFQLPDLRGRGPVGLNPDDADFNALGHPGGEKEFTLGVNEMPSHQHAVTITNAGNHQHFLGTFTGSYQEAKPGAGALWFQGGVGDQGQKTSDTGDHGHAATSSAVGASQPKKHLQPYLTLNFIIKY